MKSSPIYLAILVLVLIIIVLSFVPYREQFTLNNFYNDMTCVDVVKNTNNSVYTSTLNNAKRSETLRVLKPAFKKDTKGTEDIYNPTQYCTIEPDARSRFGLNDACSHPNSKYQISQGDANLSPDGCIVDTKAPWFADFLEESEKSLHKVAYDEISNGEQKKRELISLIDIANADIVRWRDEQNSLNNEIPALLSTNNNLANEVMQTNQRLINSNQDTYQGIYENGEEIKNMHNITKNGIYNIRPRDSPSASPLPTYCLLDPNYDGGGWMLLAKMNGNTSTFTYHSRHWKESTTLNDLLEGNRTDADYLRPVDAKYPVFNTVPIRDVMIIFLTDTKGGAIPAERQTTEGAKGWIWISNNWCQRWCDREPQGCIAPDKVTALSGFQKSREAPIKDPFQFDPVGIDNGMWSVQKNSNRVVFGGHSVLTTDGTINHGSVRWGIVSNENGADTNNFTTNDAYAGVGGGLNWPFGGFTNGWVDGQHGICKDPSDGSCFSAGNYHLADGWITPNGGILGRKMRYHALLFGR